MKKYLLFTLLLLIAVSLFSQTGGSWRQKKCAVVLTYDDALNVHLDNAIPALDSLGLKGTFYLSGYMPGCKLRLNDWKKASVKGHELANHTLFHPCIGNTPGREWVSAERDLSKYTVQRMVDETKMTNVLLEALDGKKPRTFAYTCGDMKVNDTSFIDQLKNDFIAARGVTSQMHTIDKVDLYNVDCYPVNGETGEQLIELVKKATASNTLLVFLFHGVGGEHSLNVSLPAHSQLLHYLKQHEKDIWIAPMVTIAAYIKQNQHK